MSDATESRPEWTRGDGWACLALVLVVGALAFASHWRLQGTPVRARDDAFFRCDAATVYRDFATPRGGDHTRNSMAHPTFTLLHHGAAAAVARGLQATGVGEEAALPHAVAALTSLAGGLTAAGVYALLRGARLRRRTALAAGLLAGAAPGTLFFAAVPETWVFTGLGVTATAVTVAWRHALRPWAFCLAGTYATACLTASVVPVGLLALARWWPAAGPKRLRRWVLGTALAMATVVGATMGLSLVQRAVFPQTLLFFLPATAKTQEHWLQWERLKAPGETASLLAKHFWLTNVAPPSPTVKSFKTSAMPAPVPMASVERARWPHFRKWWPAWLPWALVLASAVPGLCRRAHWTPLTAGLWSVLAFDFAFYFVFGNDRLLYAASWTPVIVATVALAQHATSLPRRAAFLPDALLATAAIAVAVRGWIFIGELAAAPLQG